MKRVFDYKTVTIENIERNSHLIFICDADGEKVILEREEEESDE